MLEEVPLASPVQKTGGYCWRTYFHAIQPRLLRWILQVPVPSTMVYARHNFRPWGVRQQYTAVNRKIPIQLVKFISARTSRVQTFIVFILVLRYSGVCPVVTYDTITPGTPK